MALGANFHSASGTARCSLTTNSVTVALRHRYRSIPPASSHPTDVPNARHRAGFLVRGPRAAKGTIPMPLILNVGLSRKTSENYNSAGTSINLTTELDQSLFDRPRELQGAIDELYVQAELALEQQSRGRRRESDTEPRHNGSSTDHRNGNGHPRNGHDRGGSTSGAGG